MPLAVSASNVMWGVLFVYVARKVLSMSEAKKVEQTGIETFPTEMKDTQIGLKAPEVLPRGPYAEQQ
jgi:hypothetical protein